MNLIYSSNNCSMQFLPHVQSSNSSFDCHPMLDPAFSLHFIHTTQTLEDNQSLCNST